MAAPGDEAANTAAPALTASGELPAFLPEKVRAWKASLAKERNRQELVRLLEKTLIFADTTRKFRSEIIDAVLPATYEVGQVVLRSGQPGDWMGIVIAGQCARFLDRGGKQIAIGEVCPGGVIGDLGLLGITPSRSFTVFATRPTTLLVLTRQSYEAAVAKAGGPQAATTLSHAAEMQGLLHDVRSFLNLRCFRGLAEEFVLTLRENSEPRLYYPNQVLMKQGHYGCEMFILRHGSVRVERDNKTVCDLKSGVVIGELAVLGSDKRRTATVVCTALCLVRVLHADVFHDIVDRHPHEKRVFDHRYIARLVHCDVTNAKEEKCALDAFNGSVMPRSTLELQQLLGKDQVKRPAGKALTMASVASMPPPPQRISTRDGAVAALPPLSPGRKADEEFVQPTPSPPATTSGQRRSIIC